MHENVHFRDTNTGFSTTFSDPTCIYHLQHHRGRLPPPRHCTIMSAANSTVPEVSDRSVRVVSNRPLTPRSTREMLHDWSGGRLSDVLTCRRRTLFAGIFVISRATWNSLSEDVQSASSLTIFRRQLKHQLFRQSYPDIVL